MKILSIFNAKIKLGIIGRKHSFDVLNQLDKTKKIIWMHASSLGEYEQGLSVLKNIKLDFPSDLVVISFFSPSGYEHIKTQNHLADALIYLPFDTKKNARKIAEIVNIRLFYTVKYDFWYHLFSEFRLKNIPVFVVSCLFYEKQFFFKSYGKWFVNQLKKTVNLFFHQTEKSLELAIKIGLTNGICTGDTRFDRVKQLALSKNNLALIEEFKNNAKLVVFGSSWDDEEQIADELIMNNWNGKIILAPHDMKRVAYFKSKHQSKALLYSDLQSGVSKITNENILIIDCIGLLSQIYQYADFAVVGGGFKQKALHNILEALSYGKPVFFGNKYCKNPEADAAIEYQAAFSFENSSSASQFILEKLSDYKINEFSKNAIDFINSQSNAGDKIRVEILKFFL